jgi:hypothetical protein
MAHGAPSLQYRFNVRKIGRRDGRRTNKRHYGEQQNWRFRMSHVDVPSQPGRQLLVYRISSLFIRISPP